MLVCDIIARSFLYSCDVAWIEPLNFCLAILYAAVYLRLIVCQNIHSLSLRSLLLPYLFYRLLAFILLAFIIWDPSNIDFGDASSYHIPRALSIDNPLEYLFRAQGDYNGRLSHVLLWMTISLVRALRAYYMEYSIASIYYCINTLFVLASAVIVHSFVRRTYANHIACRSTAILLCSPLVLGYSFLPQKESLFLLLSVLAFCSICSLSSGISSIFVFALATLLATFERFYVLPFFVFSFLLQNFYLLRHSSRFLRTFLFIFVPILFLLCFKVSSFLSVETAQFMMNTSLDSNVGGGSYSFGLSGLAGNIFKVSFGPAGLPRYFSQFMIHSYASFGFVYLSGLILSQLLVPISLFASLRYPRSPGSLILLGLYAYLVFTVPHVYAFKLLEIYVILAVYPPLATAISDSLSLFGRLRLFSKSTMRQV